MNTTRRVIKNSFALISSHIVSKFFYFFIIVLLTRLLGVEDFGKLTFALSFVILFSILPDIGISTLAIREVAKNKEDALKYLLNGVVSKLIFSIIAFCLLSAVINVMHSSASVIHVVYILGLWMIIDSFSYFAYSFFRAFEKMEYEAYLNAVEKAILLALVFAAYRLHFELMHVACIFLAVSAAKLLLGMYFTSIVIKPVLSMQVVLNIKFCKEMLKESWPFALMAVFGMIYFRIDTVMLEMMKGSYAVGLYNAAHKLMEGLTFIPQMFTAALFPAFSNLYVTSREKLVLGYEKGFKILFIVALPVALGGTLLSKNIVLFMYGSDFAGSAAALQVLLWALFFVFLNFIIGTVLNSINRQRLLTLNTAVCMVINFILNLALIPKYSFVGAGVATIATEGILCLLGFFWVSKYLHRLPVARVVFKPLIAALIMGFCVYYLLHLNLFLVILIGAVVYFACLLVLKVVTFKEIGHLNMLFPRNLSS